MITVEATKDGPDYDGYVIIHLDQDDRIRPIVSVGLGIQDARELFGKLGDAIKVIEANQGPEAPRA